MNIKTHPTTIPKTTVPNPVSMDSNPQSVPNGGECLNELNQSALSGRMCDNWSDAELLKAHIESRCPDAFREIVLRYGPMVLGVCRRILFHNELVEDAFQDTFVILANNGGRIREPDLLASWLYGVARRTCMESQRKLRKETDRVVSLPSEIMSQYPDREASSQVAEASIEVALRDAIDQLPDAYRAPLVLCYFMGETHASAAQALGVPPGSISTKLRVGQEKLRDKLKRMGFVVPLVAVTWLLSQMRVDAQVPEQLISSTLAKTTSLVDRVGPADSLASRLADGWSKQHPLLRYLVVALCVLSVIATAEACFVLPGLARRPAKIEQVDNPALGGALRIEPCGDEK